MELLVSIGDGQLSNSQLLALRALRQTRWFYLICVRSARALDLQNLFQVGY